MAEGEGLEFLTNSINWAAGLGTPEENTTSTTSLDNLDAVIPAYSDSGDLVEQLPVTTTTQYALVAGNQQIFAYDAAAGEVSVQDPSLLVAGGRYELIFEVSENGNVVRQAVLTIAVTWPNRAPWIELPAGPFDVLENSLQGTFVGQLSAQDADPNSVLTWEITSGNTAGGGSIADVFNIDANGNLTVNQEAAMDFEAEGPFQLIVQVTDDVSWNPLTSDPVTVTINLTDIGIEIDGSGVISVIENSPPGTSAGFIVPKDWSGTATLDYTITQVVDGNGNTYSATDFDLIEIDQSTGQILTANQQILDYEALPGNPWFDLRIDVTTVGATPSESGFGFIRIPITDGNEVPSFHLENVVSTLPENTSTPVKVADIIISDDALQGANGNQISLIDSGTGDADSFEAIKVNEGLWQLFVKAGTTLDFEGTNPYTIDIQLDDDEVGVSPDDVASYSLSLTDENEPAQLILTQNLIEVSEDVDVTNGGYHVGYVDLVDPDGPGTGNNGAPAMSGVHASFFGLVAHSTIANRWDLLLVSPVDYEQDKVLSIEIVIDDPDISGTPDHQVNGQLTILDVNDTAPDIAVGQVVSIPEDAPLGSVHTLVNFIDPDTIFTTFTWAVTGGITDGTGNGNYADAFSIETYDTGTGTAGLSDGLRGRVVVDNETVLDFDNGPTSFILHDVVLTDVDSGLVSDPVDVTINVTDVNDNPPVVPPGQSVSVIETAPNDSTHGTIVATDVDTVGTYTWSITSDFLGDDNVIYTGLFDIVGTTDGANGEKQALLKVLDTSRLDYDVPPQSYSFDVTLFDGIHTTTESVTAVLLDANDNAPTIDSQSFTIQENSPVGTAVSTGPVQFSDIDTVGVHDTWEINDAEGIFIIDSAGQIRVGNQEKLDYEQFDPLFSVTVDVRLFDGQQWSDWVPMTVSITNVVEPAEISVTLQAQDLNVPDNTGVVDFGVLDGQQAESRVFTITNHGDSTLDIGLTDAIQVPAGFALVGPDSFSIPRFGSQDFEIQFVGGAAGTYSGEVTFSTNEVDDAANVDGLYENPYNFTVTGEVQSEPTSLRFGLDPGADFRMNGVFDFGTTVVGSESVYRFRLSNDDPQNNLEVYGITLPTGFAIDLTTANPVMPSQAAPWVLAPGEARQFQILTGDIPAAAGDYWGDLTIDSNDATAPEFKVKFNSDVNSADNVQIVDDGDPGFTTSGAWSTITDTGYELDSQYTNDDSFTASWNFGVLAPGLYSVATTWVGPRWPNLAATRPNTNSYADAIYDVTVGTGSASSTTTHTVDQFDRPRGFDADDHNWHLLDVRVIDGEPLTVTLRLPGDGTYVIADAVRVERLQPVTDVVTLPSGRGQHDFDLTLNDPDVFHAWATDGSSALSREWAVEFETVDSNGNPNGFSSELTLKDGIEDLGRLTSQVDGSVRLSMAKDYRSHDREIQFRYRLVNQDGIATAPAPVSILLTDDAPLASIDYFETSHGRALTFDPLWNDRDPEGDGLSIGNLFPEDGLLNGTQVLDRREFFVEIPAGTSWNLEFGWLNDPNGPVTVSGISSNPENDLPGALTMMGLINDPSQVVIEEVNNSPRTKRIRFTDDILQLKELQGFTVAVTSNGPDPVFAAHKRGDLLANSDNTWTFTPDREFFRLAGPWTERFFYTATDGENTSIQVQETQVDITNSAPIGTVAGELVGFYDVPTETLGIPDRPEISLHNAIPLNLYDADGDPLYFVSVDTSTNFGSFNALDPIQPDGVLDFVTIGREQGEITGSPIFSDVVHYRFTDGYSYTPVFSTDITARPNRSLTGSELFGSIQVTGTTSNFGVQNDAGVATALSTDWRLDARTIGANPERPLASVDLLNLDLETGNVSFDYALDTNRSPTFGGHSLHYDSNAVAPRPVVQATLSRPANSGNVTELRASLKWSAYTVDGTGLTTTALDLDSYATAIRYTDPSGGTNTDEQYNITLQASEAFGNDIVAGILSPGLYRWELTTTLIMDDGSEVELLSTGDALAHHPQADSTSPFGGLPNGWTIGGIPDLILLDYDESDSSASERIKDDQIFMAFSGGGHRRFKAPADTSSYTEVTRNGATISLSAPWSAIDMGTRLDDLEEFGELRRIAFNGTNSWGPNDSWLYTAVDNTEFLFDNSGSLYEIQPPSGPATTLVHNGLGHLWQIVSPDTGVTQFNYSGTQLQSISLPGGTGVNDDRTIHLTPSGPGALWDLDELTVRSGATTIERLDFDYFTGKQITGIINGDPGTTGDSVVTVTYDTNTGVAETILPGSDPDNLSEFTPSGLVGWAPGTAFWMGGNVVWSAGPPAEFSQTSDRVAELISPEFDGQHPIDQWQLDKSARIAAYVEMADSTDLSTQTWDRNLHGHVVQHTDELNRTTRFTRDYSVNDGEKPVYFGGVSEVFYGYPQATTQYLQTDDGGYIAASFDARQVASAVYFDNKNRARISAGPDGSRSRWVFGTSGGQDDVLTQQTTTYFTSSTDIDGRIDTDTRELVTTTTDFTGYQADRLPRTVVTQDDRNSEPQKSVFTYTDSGEVDTREDFVNDIPVSTTDYEYHGPLNAVKSVIVKDSADTTLSNQSWTFYTSGRVDTAFDGLGFSKYEYNNRGLTSKVLSGASSPNDFSTAYETEYTYHDNGALHVMTAPDGHTETHEHDLASRSSSVTTNQVKATGIHLTAGSTSQVINSTYDEAGRTLTVFNSLTGANVTNTNFDHYDRVTETFTTAQLSADASVSGITTSYSYDAAGNLLQSHLEGDGGDDQGLAPVGYDYDRFGYLSRTEVVAHGGSIVEFTNDAAGLTYQQTEQRFTPAFINLQGAVTYDDGVDVVSKAYSDGFGRLRRSEDAEGNSVDLTYAISEIAGWQPIQLPGVTTVTHLRSGPSTTDTVTTESWNDALGRPAYSKDASGIYTATDYDLTGRVTTNQILNSSGQVIREQKTTVDLLGRPSTIGQLNPGTSTGLEVRYEYPTQQNYDSFLNSPATYWDTRWDGSISNTVDTASSGSTPETRFTSDSLGNTVRTVSADPDGTGPLASPVTRFDYDYAASDGYSATTIDPLNRSWQTTVNSFGAVLENTDAGGVRQFSGTYDTAGRLKSQKDALNNFTETTFHRATGQAATTSVPQADGVAVTATTQTVYDSAGNLVHLADPEGNITTWVYDGLGRRTTEQTILPKWDSNNALLDGEDDVVQRTWQHNGLTTIYTDRNGRTLTYVSDPVARETTETWSDGRVITLTANEAGQLAMTQDADGADLWTQIYTYDDLGRLDFNTFDYSISGTSVYDTRADHGYTDTGVRDDLKFDLNGTQQIHKTAVVDDLNRITSLAQANAGSGPAQQVVFNYRADSSLDSLQRNEIDGGTTPIAFTDYSYFTTGSSTGDLQSIDHQYQSDGGVQITRYDYTYDNAHRINTFDSSRDGLNDYGYDAENQLESATLTNENYTYDENGNRTNTGYETRQHNLLVADAKYNYVYDQEGNRTDRIDKTTGESVHYDWDHRNRLTLIIFLNGSGAETKRVEYEYNVDNLRIAKRVSTDGGTTWDIQRYALDGSDVVLVFDKNENVEHTYFHGPAVDQIFADENATGEILWALSDHQGTVRDWIDADDASTNSSAPTQHVEYSAFGEILAATDEATLPSYAYTGREWDADAELYYYRNRWYDPVIGKFANDDPIGFAAGDSNLQRYVGNNSPNAVDPDGLVEYDYAAGKEFKNGRVSGDGKSFVMNEAVRDSGGVLRKTVPLENGTVNFNRWSRGDVIVSIVGDDSFDQGQAKAAYVKKFGRSPGKEMTFHHDRNFVKVTVNKAGPKIILARMQLVPSKLNAQVPHEGAAAKARGVIRDFAKEKKISQSKARARMKLVAKAHNRHRLANISKVSTTKGMKSGRTGTTSTRHRGGFTTGRLVGMAALNGAVNFAVLYSYNQAYLGTAGKLSQNAEIMGLVNLLNVTRNNTEVPYFGDLHGTRLPSDSELRRGVQLSLMFKGKLSDLRGAYFATTGKASKITEYNDLIIHIVDRSDGAYWQIQQIIPGAGVRTILDPGKTIGGATRIGRVK